jgi:hypothetical protein
MNSRNDYSDLSILRRPDPPKEPAEWRRPTAWFLVGAVGLFCALKVGVQMPDAAGLVLAALYFIPAFVAGCRGHRNTGAIVALNLLLGWTIIGWIGALVWACTDNTRQELIR